MGFGDSGWRHGGQGHAEIITPSRQRVRVQERSRFGGIEKPLPAAGVRMPE
jgi:hypothetical protein